MDARRVSVVAALAVLLAGCATSSRLMSVAVPVVDLRAQPHTTAQPGVHDPLQETQLLYGERVKVRGSRDNWSRVEAVEQREFSHSRRWEGYPGWVPSSSLRMLDPLDEPTIVVTDKWAAASTSPHGTTPSSWQFPMGTRLKAWDMAGHVWKIALIGGEDVWVPNASARSLSGLRSLAPSAQRRLVVSNAERLIGDAYVWGGRSPGNVDCSGLVNLAYRAAGVDIPRDAHEQSLRAQAVPAPQPADLIFLSERDHPQQVVHVMLYAGDGTIIEGPGTGMTVRRISVQERLRRPLKALAAGTVVDGQTVTYGSYLP